MGTAAISFGPKLGLLNNAAIGEQYYDEFRPFLRGVDALVQASAIDWALTDPPPSPANGDTYILTGTGFTGAWSGHDNQIAVWSTQVTDSGGNVLDPDWDFYIPQTGWVCWTNSPSTSIVGFIFFNGTSWIDPNTSIPYMLFTSSSTVYVNEAGTQGTFGLLYQNGTIQLAVPGTADTGGQLTLTNTSGAALASSGGAEVLVKGTQVVITGGSAVAVGEASSTSPLDITKNSYWLINSNGSYTSATLPAISTAPGLSGFEVTLKLIGTTSFTINSAGSDTIEGASSYVLSAQYKYVTLVSSTPSGGSPTWFIVANN